MRRLARLGRIRYTAFGDSAAATNPASRLTTWEHMSNPLLIHDTTYAYVRGFNYQPSYASHGIEIWGSKFDLAAIDRELSRGKQYFPGMNTVRLWLSHDAYVLDGHGFVQNVDSVLDLADRHGIRFIVTLFNGWRSCCPEFGSISAEQITVWDNWDVGVTSRDYYGRFLADVVGPHASDDRVLMWDLCNEPLLSSMGDHNRDVILGWLAQTYDTCKQLGAEAPLCVGSIPNMWSVKMLAPMSDVLTAHPYFAWNSWLTDPADLESFLDEAVAYANDLGKALLVTETGWGSLDDAKRVETLAVELGALARRKIGFTAHLLHETLVADGHRPQYGPVTVPGYMAFVNMDGSLRPGHEVFNRF